MKIFFWVFVSLVAFRPGLFTPGHSDLLSHALPPLLIAPENSHSGFGLVLKLLFFELAWAILDLLICYGGIWHI